MLYIATLGVAFIAHFILCYPAAVARGYPPVDPFWEYIAIYAAFITPVISPVFEDFSDSPNIRKAVLSIFAIAAAVVTAVPLANIAGARPRVGRLAGYIGVWQHEFAIIVVTALFVSLVAVPFVICIESIARTLWGKIRKLPQHTAA